MPNVTQKDSWIACGMNLHIWIIATDDEWIVCRGISQDIEVIYRQKLIEFDKVNTSTGHEQEERKRKETGTGNQPELQWLNYVLMGAGGIVLLYVRIAP